MVFNYVMIGVTKHFSSTGGDQQAGTGEESDGQPEEQPHLWVAPQPGGQLPGSGAPTTATHVSLPPPPPPQQQPM